MNKTGHWKNNNVLITGINGFIGGNLAKTLVESGARVFGLERNLDEHTFLYYEGIASKVVLVQGDLICLETLKRIITEEQIQVCFHLGAQVEVGVARQYPYLTWDTNVRGTYTLMEAFRECGRDIKAIVIASSDKAYGCYGEDRMPYKEDYPLIPQFPYDVSKACADMIARSYASELYSLPVIVTRFCNIYGPGQLNFSALIPDVIRAACGYGSFTPRGDGVQIRDFIYVKDAIELYLALAEHIAENKERFAGEVFNAGTNKPKRIKDIIYAIYGILEKENEYADIEQQFKGKEAMGEIDCQYMDYEKVNRFVGWSPQTPFDTGLRETVKWYQKYLSDSTIHHRS